MLMKRGVGLVPYPPVLPTYSHPISYWIEMSSKWDRIQELLDTPNRAVIKLDKPDLAKVRKEVPLKSFKLFFKYSTGKPNFNAYRVIS